MYRLFRMIQKEFAQLRRDPRMFGIMLVAPVIQLVIIGYGATTDINNLQLGVCDLDRSYESRELVRTFTSSDYFQLGTVTDTPDQLDRDILTGEIAVGLIIPPDFGHDLTLGREPRTQLLIDGSDSMVGTLGLTYAKTVMGLFSRPYAVELATMMRSRDIRPPQINVEIRAWFNPELKSRVYMVPAGIGLVLLLIMIMLTAMALVKEREIGTMEQLIVTPIKRWELLLGKILPFVIIGLVAETIIILVAIFLFDTPLRGNVATLYLLSFGFFFTTLGLGIFISTISKTQQQAMMVTAFFVMMPFVYLSGFIFPIENMPRLFQYISCIIPLRYFLVICRGVFLKGTGWIELWDEFFFMVLLGVFIFSAAVIRFRKNLE